MRQGRRALLTAAGLSLMAPNLARAQSGQPWPRGGTIRLIVPFGTGGATDIVSRIIAESMSRHLGQTIIVDNRPGAGATIGTGMAAQAPADGYTLAVSTISGMAVGQTLYRDRITWDADRDFAHIGMILLTPWVLCVRADGPVRDLPGLLAEARRANGLSYGTTGVGSVAHLLGVRLAAESGATLEHIPYRAFSQSSADVMNGTLGAAIESLTATSSLLRAGTLRPLAMSMRERSPLFPEIPTFRELGFQNLVAEGWAGLAAPKGTPRPVLEALANALKAAQAEPAIQRRLADMSSTPGNLFLDEAQAFVRAEVAEWAPIVRASGAVPG